MADEDLSQEDIDRIATAFADVLDKKLGANGDVDITVEKMRMLVNEKLDLAQQDLRREIRDDLKTRIDGTEKQIASHYNFLKLTGSVVVIVAGGFATFFGITNKDSIDQSVQTQVSNVMKEKRSEISALQNQIRVQLDTIKEKNRETSAILTVARESIERSKKDYSEKFRKSLRTADENIKQIGDKHSETKKMLESVTKLEKIATTKTKEIKEKNTELNSIKELIDGSIKSATESKFSNFSAAIATNLKTINQENVRRQDLEILTSPSLKAFLSNRALLNFKEYSNAEKRTILTYFANKKPSIYTLYPFNRDAILPTLEAVLVQANTNPGFQNLRSDIGLIYGVKSVLSEFARKMKEQGDTGVAGSFAQFEEVTKRVSRQRQGIIPSVLKSFQKQILEISVKNGSFALREKALSYISADISNRGSSRVLRGDILVLWFRDFLTTYPAYENRAVVKDILRRINIRIQNNPVVFDIYDEALKNPNLGDNEARREIATAFAAYIAKKRNPYTSRLLNKANREAFMTRVLPHLSHTSRDASRFRRILNFAGELASSDRLEVSGEKANQAEKIGLQEIITFVDPSKSATDYQLTHLKITGEPNKRTVTYKLTHKGKVVDTYPLRDINLNRNTIYLSRDFRRRDQGPKRKLIFAIMRVNEGGKYSKYTVFLHQRD